MFGAHCCRHNAPFGASSIAQRAATNIEPFAHGVQAAALMLAFAAVQNDESPAGQRSTAGVYRNPWQRLWVETGRSYGFSVRTRNSV